MPRKTKVKTFLESEFNPISRMELSDEESDSDDEEFLDFLFGGKYLKILEAELNKEPKKKHKQKHRKHGKKHGFKHKKAKKRKLELPMSHTVQSSLYQHLPDKFYLGDCVLNFGLPEKDASEPAMKPVVDSDKAPKRKRRAIRPRKQTAKASARKSTVARRLAMEPAVESPPIDREWLDDRSFRAVTPISDLEWMRLPSSEDIWSSYKAFKEGGVAKWPVNFLCGEQSLQSNQQYEQLYEADKSPEEEEEEVEEEETIFDHDFGDQTEAENWLVNWEHVFLANAENAPLRETYNDGYLNTARGMEMSVDEERAMADWIKTELLNEPLSDIEEFDVLLTMARNYKQNGAALHELLKPKLPGQEQVKTVRKCAPKALETFVGEQSKSAVPIQLVSSMNKQSMSMENRAEKLAAAAAAAAATAAAAAAAAAIAAANEQRQLAEHEETLKRQAQQTVASCAEEPEEPEEPKESTKEEALEAAMTEQSHEVHEVDEAELQAAINSLMTLENPLENEEVAVDEPLMRAEESAGKSLVQEMADTSAGDVDTEEATINQWLQQCELAISQQLQTQWQQLATKEVAEPTPPASASKLGNKSQNSSQPTPGRMKACVPQQGDSQWQSSYKLMLDNYDDTVGGKISEFRDPLAKRLRSKRNAEQKNIMRSLLMPPLPSHQDNPQGHVLQHIRILRPMKRKLEQSTLQIEMKVIRVFCTFEVNCPLDLKSVVKQLDNAVYNSDIDVIEVRYDDLQMAWVWQNGSAMIINGRNQSALSGMMKHLAAKLLGYDNMNAVPMQNVLHFRLMSWVTFPWCICVEQFSEAYTLTAQPWNGSSRYIYYVDRSFPCVSARVYETGMVHVFAMSNAHADKMLQKLYLLTSNHRKESSQK